MDSYGTGTEVGGFEGRVIFVQSGDWQFVGRLVGAKVLGSGLTQIRMDDVLRLFWERKDGCDKGRTRYFEGSDGGWRLTLAPGAYIDTIESYYGKDKAGWYAKVVTEYRKERKLEKLVKEALGEKAGKR